MTIGLGESVNFSGIGSTSGGLALTEFRWSIDGQFIVDSQTFTYVFNSAGTFAVTFQVGDERGVRSSAAGPVLVTVNAPTPTPVPTVLNVSAGSVSGTWSAPTVNLLGDVTVPAGQTLTIQPGVTINFSSGLTVDGTLIVQGTASQPIVMQSSTSTPWSGITVGTGAGITSTNQFTLSHVKILDVAQFGIHAPGVDSAGYSRFYLNLDSVTVTVTCSTGECAGIHFHGPLSGTIKDISITVSGTGSVLNGIFGDLDNIDFQGSNTITVTATGT